MTTSLLDYKEVSSLPVGFGWKSQEYKVTIDWNLAFGRLVGDLNEVHVHPETSLLFISRLGGLVRQGSGTFSEAISQVLQIFVFEEPVEIMLLEDHTKYLRPARNGDSITYKYKLENSLLEEQKERTVVAWTITGMNQDGKEIISSAIKVAYYKAILK